MSVQVLHRCDASVARVSVVEVVKPLAFLPVPETTARTRTRTHTHTGVISEVDGPQWSLLGSSSCPSPDAVLVGHSDAAVERVEFHHRRHPGVPVNEDLVVQSGNTWTVSKEEQRFLSREQSSVITAL